jgi:hypothetical protein
MAPLVRPAFTGRLAPTVAGLLVVVVATALLSGCTAARPLPTPAAASPTVNANSASFSADGKRVHIAAASGCPATLGKATDVFNVISASPALLPTAPSPLAGLICSYGSKPGNRPTSTPGSSGKPSKVRFTSGLTHQATLSASDDRRLAATITALSMAPPPPGPVNCPMALVGEREVLVLSYSPSLDIDLWFEDTGCETLDNGTLTSWQIANPSFSKFVILAQSLAR